MMRRIVRVLLFAISLAPACGCGGLGWYQAIGHLPGIAHTDYAYYDFCGTSSQLFPYSVPQIESAVYESLGDLGYKDLGPAIRHPDGVVLIHAHTADGRPADISLTPQNAMTNARVVIGPMHAGDQNTAHELLRRIALCFGTVMRAYTPIDTTVPRRFNLPRPLSPSPLSLPPETLKGEGLRPGESRDRAASEEETEPDLNNPDADMLRNMYQRFIPTRDFPNPPYLPYSPFPYTPF